MIAHTNLDKAHGGFGDIVANMLGLEQTAPLRADCRPMC